VPRRLSTTLVAVCSCVALVPALAGCGGGSSSKVDLLIKKTTITRHPGRKATSQTQGFQLSCDPNSGNLPFVGRLCRDIAQHPAAMLDPPPTLVSCSVPRTRVLVTISVSAAVGGKTTGFGGQPGCAAEGRPGLAVYDDAIRGAEADLARDEPLLQCSAAAAQQDPEASLFACTHGGWTAANTRLIRAARTGLHVPNLFPAQVGTRNCKLGGGPSAIQGRCGVAVDSSARPAAVTFVAYWGPGGLRPITSGGSILGFQASDPTRMHQWRVLVAGNRVAGISQNGPQPPRGQS
jgi:hypothetical protein